MTHGRLAAATTAAALVTGGMILAVPAASAQDSPGRSASAPGQVMMDATVPDKVDLTAKLHQLNRSGARGTATATVDGQTITDFSLSARGLTPDGPHAVHIHYGDQAANECPTMGDATEQRSDGTRRLSTSDGAPSYGPIVVSLTTTGDTTPASALDLERMPMAEGGALDYSRGGIMFTDVDGTGYGADGSGTAAQIAEAIRDGEGVVVVHGVDYNRNGEYDLDGAGASDLTAAAPAEATDPALCGVLEAHKR